MNHIEYLGRRKLVLEHRDILEEKLKPSQRSLLDQFYGINESSGIPEETRGLEPAYQAFENLLQVKMAELKVAAEKKAEEERLRAYMKPFFLEFYKEQQKEKKPLLSKEKTRWVVDKVKEEVTKEIQDTEKRIYHNMRAEKREIAQMISAASSLPEGISNRLETIFNRLRAIDAHFEDLENRLNSIGK